MTEVPLGYGRGSLNFSFDPNRLQVLTANTITDQALTDVEIGDALSNPIQSPQLEDLVSAGDSVSDRRLRCHEGYGERPDSKPARAPLDSKRSFAGRPCDHLRDRNPSAGFGRREDRTTNALHRSARENS